MSTLDNTVNNQQTIDNSIKTGLIFNMAGTVFLILFGAIYEFFSHGVYSYFMIYAFTIPLLMGVIPYQIFLLKERTPSRIFLNLWNSAIATLSIGSIFEGVLEIYGTTNKLVYIYPIAGAILIFAGIISVLISKKHIQEI